MPGAAAVAGGGSLAADTATTINLPAGRHSIIRTGDLVYCPAIVSDGQGIFNGAGTVLTDSQGATSWQYSQSDYGSGADYYCSASFTGAPTISVYATDANRTIMVWNVPNDVKWEVKDLLMGTTTVGTSDDALLTNIASIGSSVTTVNSFGFTASAWLQTASATSSLVRSLLQYYMDEDSGTGTPGRLFDHVQGGSSIIFSKRSSDIEAGDQFLNMRLLVKETPTVTPMITINIPGKAPITVGGESSFEMPYGELVTYTPNASGVYEIKSH